MGKILVLDNYDSFTYNLIHYLKELTSDTIDVYRNDKIALADVAAYDKILLSPGPGIPSEAGIMPELIKMYGSTKCILGVCLGHQAITEAYGGQIFNLDSVYHGIQTTMTLVDPTDKMYDKVLTHFEAGRYHSWNSVKETLPSDLIVTVVDSEGKVMGIRHKTHNVRGVQFHPESVLTPQGKLMIKNWLEL